MCGNVSYYSAIMSQKDWLNKARESAIRALNTSEFERAVGEIQRVCIVGMGASYHSAEVLRLLLIESGIGVTNLSASDWGVVHEASVSDLTIFVSESGRSPEPINVARQVPGFKLTVTNAPESPLAKVVDSVVPMGGFSDSKVYTVGYTCTLVIYGILADVLTNRDPALRRSREVEVMAEAVERGNEVSWDLVEGVGCPGAIDFVASGYGLASAGEGALITREANKLHGAAFDTDQYRHGPKDALKGGSGLVLIGDESEIATAEELSGSPANILLITSVREKVSRRLRERVAIADVPAGLGRVERSLYEIGLVQLICNELANKLGQDAGSVAYPVSGTKLD